MKKLIKIVLCLTALGFLIYSSAKVIKYEARIKYLEKVSHCHPYAGIYC